MKTLALGLPLMFAAACGGVSPEPAPFAGTLRLSIAGSAQGWARVHLDGAAADPSPPTGPVPSSTARAALGSELAFDASTMSLGLSARDDRGYLEALALPLGDLRVHASNLPAAGWQLRDLVVRVVDPVPLRVTRTGDAIMALDGTATLALAWALELPDGDRYPLGALDIGPVTLHVGLSAGDDDIVGVQLFAMCAESCGGLDGIFSLSGGMLSVATTTESQRPAGHSPDWFTE